MLSTHAKHPEKIARLFHALSDETRLRIMERLRDGEQCVCDLTDTFRTGQSRLSFHLKVLKDAGLVQDRPQGRWIYYSLNQKGLDELEACISQMKNAAARSTRSSECC